MAKKKSAPKVLPNDQRWFICRHIATGKFYVRCFNPHINPQPKLKGYELIHPSQTITYARNLAKTFNITLSN